MVAGLIEVFTEPFCAITSATFHNVNNHDNSYKGFHDEGKFEKLSDVIKLSLLGVDL